jgi:hypothetical protein
MIGFNENSLLTYSFPGHNVQNDPVRTSILQNYSAFRFIDLNDIKHDLASAAKEGYNMSCKEILQDLYCIEGTWTYNKTGFISTFSIYDNIIKKSDLR